ncbi:hypothetical protein OUZ56_029751 [Daphnia magna]|uniref:Major facilitator superfamily (MFS) profile domain-containing protein n=1 Tax=Daphnia magna TaxID=35525 RepID=A0ABR0B7Q9_9CRUS|nr:hypothetical protein OUZ56_029751 [Daphnia magna]
MKWLSNLVFDIVFVSCIGGSLLDRFGVGCAAVSLVGLVGVGELLVVVGLQHFLCAGSRN